MDAQKVDMFIMANSSNLPEEVAPFVREKLLALDDSKWADLSTIQFKFKNPTTALLLSIFLGCYGVDRFYIGNTGMGIGKLLTCGGLGIWTIIDWFLISSSTKEQNYNKLKTYL
ncbi:TM2 domain-containing protein [Prevotella sp.]|uniref:TM2 domain-containing protein n=1 Tax=Prevotella sp. TaxID=59823 RepID=UPI002F92B406